MIISFTIININNVDLDQIQGLYLILGLDLIPYLDNYQFFLPFHVSDICPLLDRYQKHKILRKIYMCPKQDNTRKCYICPLLFIFAHL